MKNKNLLLGGAILLGLYFLLKKDKKSTTKTSETKKDTPTITKKDTPTISNKYRRIYITKNVSTRPIGYCGFVTNVTNKNDAYDSRQYETYHNGSTPLPQLGDKLFRKEVGTDKYSEFYYTNNYFGVSANPNTKAQITIRTNIDRIVTDIYDCKTGRNISNGLLL
jgi:hypothetical protein